MKVKGIGVEEKSETNFKKTIFDSRQVEIGSCERSLNELKGKLAGSVERIKPSVDINYLLKDIPDKKLNKMILSQNKLSEMLKKNIGEGSRKEFLKIFKVDSMEQAAGKLCLTEEKLDKIWQEGIAKDIDPRFLLAVLFAEGTGSFDTRVDGRGSFWNIEPDFDKDLKITVNTINGYLSDNPKINKNYYELSWKKNCPETDPIVFIGRGSCPDKLPSGGYAADVDWSDNVKTIYGLLGGYVLKDSNGKYVPPFYSEQKKYFFDVPSYAD